MLIDTHAHLNHHDFARDLDAVLQRAEDCGVGHIVVPGFDRASSETAIRLADKPRISAAVGFHPHEAAKLGHQDLVWLKEQLVQGTAVAIGEIGLDYYRDLSARETQREALQAQIELAREAGKPIIVHNRSAGADVLKILRDTEASTVGGVLHCFSENLDYATRVIELGFHIGIAGPVTYPSSDDLREVAKNVPLDRLLVETDCPYLTPQRFRGRRNEPAYVTLVAKTIAELRRLDFEEVAAATTENARRLFGLH